MDQLEPTGYNRLFYRLKIQALIKDLRGKFGDEVAFELLSRAIELESRERHLED